MVTVGRQHCYVYMAETWPVACPHKSLLTSDFSGYYYCIQIQVRGSDNQTLS